MTILEEYGNICGGNIWVGKFVCHFPKLLKILSEVSENGFPKLFTNVWSGARNLPAGFGTNTQKVGKSQFTVVQALLSFLSSNGLSKGHNLWPLEEKSLGFFNTCHHLLKKVKF